MRRLIAISVALPLIIPSTYCAVWELLPWPCVNWMGKFRISITSCEDVHELPAQPTLLSRFIA